MAYGRMARADRSKGGKRRRAAAEQTPRRRIRPLRWLMRWVLRLVTLAIFILFGAIGLYAVMNPPVTPYMVQERLRLGSLSHEWVPMEEIAPVMARAAVAAEDANFCLHWGLDVTAIRAAMDEGGTRGG